MRALYYAAILWVTLGLLCLTSRDQVVRAYGGILVVSGIVFAVIGWVD